MSMNQLQYGTRPQGRRQRVILEARTETVRIWEIFHSSETKPEVEIIPVFNRLKSEIDPYNISIAFPNITPTINIYKFPSPAQPPEFQHSNIPYSLSYQSAFQRFLPFLYSHANNHSQYTAYTNTDIGTTHSYNDFNVF